MKRFSGSRTSGISVLGDDILTNGILFPHPSRSPEGDMHKVVRFGLHTTPRSRYLALRSASRNLCCLFLVQLGSPVQSVLTRSAMITKGDNASKPGTKVPGNRQHAKCNGAFPESSAPGQLKYRKRIQLFRAWSSDHPFG